ncbi:TonB-linked outer membrane protein, SusC/RagA family [Prevotella aff. ruminicola Tc2-24]|uniref:TonB-linked outer membrane protein, SusC/RagA family n=1 Tax=Prevotella aff. ruminicola Tc2-24 TaxID=81582 RepID=A0A1I0QBU1_9BACT|nr:TonB-dependent receptor [Prevotella aff. ruminicola Tc2-24]SEW24508.1 TonB-linked outer membrane protein, SusC/RagA family [Prevotella aff. ruminicola Tc2-24]
MKKNSILLMLMALFMSVTSFAQGLMGTVIDENGEPVIGATVTDKSNAKNAAITDFDGRFTMNVNVGQIIVISYIGYDTQELAAKNGMVVRLQPDNKVLDEVVVVGYGVQKKSSVTGAISQVKPEDMENRTISNAQQALQGKTSGVQIISTSAAPGSSPTVRVRGYSSNKSSEPLYVVDGVRLSDISGIDPATIASMEILKDAASAAIYGAEAGNGVVLITTKKGKAGQGRIAYDFMWTDESLARIPKMLNAEEYKQYMTEGNLFTKDYMDANWDGKTDTRWTDVAFNHGHMQKHNLSFTGGNDRGNYYLALSYLNNNGIVKGDADTYKRLTATINGEYNIKDWLKVGTTNQIEKYDVRQVSSNNEYGSLLTAVLMMDPLTPNTYGSTLPSNYQVYQAMGKTFMQDENGNYYGISPFYNGEQYHPMIMRDNGLSKNGGFNVTGSIYGDFTLIPNLTVTSRFGYRLNGARSSSTSLPFYGNAVQSRDYVSQNNTSSTTIYYQWENFANYMQTFGNHTVTAMVGVSFQDSSYDYVTGGLEANGEDALKKNHPLFYYLNYANPSATKSVSGETTSSTKFSYFGRLGYDFLGRYMLNASLRADAADLSKLSPKKRWGYFPAVSVGWTISEEKFFQPLRKAFDSLKFRASWGQNGSLSALSGYSYSTDIALGGLYAFTPGIQYTQAAAPSTMGNEDLKWETSEQLNFGFDGILLGGRMTFGVDYYIKKTKDLLVWNTTPSLIIGGATSPINAGNVENKGFEFELGWRDRIGDFSYGIRANLSTLSNKVTYIDPSITRLAGSTFHTYTITYFEQGYPVYYFRGFEFDKINPETGDPMFKDITGDGVVNNDDLTDIGNAIPDITYGVTLTAAYKGLDLTVFGTGSHGNKIFNCINRPDYATSNKMKKVMYDDRWTPSNTNGTKPRAGANDLDKYVDSSAMIYDGSYFKIKQIQLGYTLPKSLLGKVGVSHVRVYGSLDDFFTFSGYPGFDPEAATNATTGMGVDKGAYPTSKKVVLGFNIEF